MKRFFALAVLVSIPGTVLAQPAGSPTPQSAAAPAPTVAPLNSSQGATAEARHHRRHKRGHRHHRRPANANDAKH